MQKAPLVKHPVTKPNHDPPMSKSRFEPDPEWIIPERAYAPGYEPKPQEARPNSSEPVIPWDDLWRFATGALLICGGVVLVSVLTF